MLWQGFMAFNVMLAYGACRSAAKVAGPEGDHKRRISRQVLFGYSLGFLLNGSNLILLISRGASFREVDHTTFIAAGLGLLLVLAMYWKNLLDPMAKGWYALLCKAVPQVLLAVSFWQVGGSAMPLVTLIAGHGIIVTRLIPIFVSYLKQKDPHTRGLLLSEGSNEASWLLVTLAWATTR